MKVLLDLNVVLDVILNRQPFLADSLAVWNAQQSGEFEGCQWALKTSHRKALQNQPL